MKEEPHVTHGPTRDHPRGMGSSDEFENKKSLGRQRVRDTSTRDIVYTEVFRYVAKHRGILL